MLLILAEDRDALGLAPRLVAAAASCLETRPVEYLIDLVGLLGALPARLDAGPAGQAALLMLAFDRQRGAGCGLSLGDGSVYLTDPTCPGQARRLNPRNPRLIRLEPRNSGALQIEQPETFSFQTIPRQLLQACGSPGRGAAGLGLAEAQPLIRQSAVAAAAAGPPLSSLRRFSRQCRATSPDLPLTLAASLT